MDELCWIPSHFQEKKLNKNKENRLTYLRERFKEDFEEIIKLNSDADNAANRGRMKHVSNSTVNVIF